MNRHNTRVICLAVVWVVAATLLLAGCMNAVRYTGMGETTIDLTTPDLHFPEPEADTPQVFVAAPSDYMGNLLIPQTIYTLASPEACDTVINAFNGFVLSEDAPDEIALSIHRQTAFQFHFKHKPDGKTETVLFYLSINGVIRQIRLDGSGNVTEDFYALVTTETLNWDLFAEAFHNRILIIDSEKHPTSQADMQTKFNALNRVSEENGLKTITILPDDLLSTWWFPFDPFREKVLTAEEILFLINDSIRIYDEYDRIILPGYQACFVENLSYTVPAPHNAITIVPYHDEFDGTEKEHPDRTQAIFTIISYRAMALSNTVSCVYPYTIQQAETPLPASLLAQLTGVDMEWDKNLWYEHVSREDWAFFVPSSTAACNSLYYQSIVAQTTPDFGTVDPQSLEFFRIYRDHETVQIHYGNGTEDRVVYPLFPVEKKTVLSEEDLPSADDPHRFTEWTVTKEPTCEFPGTRTRSCSHCDLVETNEIPSLGHDNEVTPTVYPTCTESGRYQTSVCRRCDFKLGRENPTREPLGHTYRDGCCLRCQKPIEYSEGLKYTLTKDKKGYIVVGMGSFTGKDLVIPPYHKDLPVVEVGDNAFTKIPLRNIYISENIVEIGSEAFYKCNAIHVTFAPTSSLRKLDYRALAFNGSQGLWDLPNYLFPYYPLYLPEPLEEIGDQALSYTNFGDIRLPSTVRIIGDKAFMGSAIGDSNLPEGLQTIGEWAFFQTSLITLRIPSSVTSIGDRAFNNIGRALSSITVAEGNPRYAANGNCLIDLKTKTLLQGTRRTVIPNDGSVETIASYAFYGIDLREHPVITIPASVRTIQPYAYDGSHIRSLKFEEGIQTIGKNAFADCFIEGPITFPTSLQSIHKTAFSTYSFDDPALWDVIESYWK